MNKLLQIFDRIFKQSNLRFSGAASVIRKPGREQQQNILSKLISVMGVLNAAATLPQVITIFNNKDASSLSLLSWGYYLVFSIVLLIFGAINQQKPLIMTYGSGVIVYSLVVAGVIVYS